MNRATAWLGLSRTSADSTTDGDIPLWRGVGARTKYAAGAICLLVAIATFVLLRWLMPADDGLSGAGPWLIAVLIGALGLSWTERSMVSAAPRRPSTADRR